MSSRVDRPRLRLIAGVEGAKSAPRREEARPPHLQVVQRSAEPDESDHDASLCPPPDTCDSPEAVAVATDAEVNRRTGAVLTFRDAESPKPRWFTCASKVVKRIELLVVKRGASTEHLHGGGAA